MTPAALPEGQAVNEHCSFTTATTDDAHEHAHCLQHWKQRYEQLSAGRFSGGVEEAWFGNVQVFRERTNQIVHEAGQAWEGSTTFGIPVETEGEGWYCGEVFNRNSILTLQGGEQLDFRTPRQLDILGVTADTAAFVDYALRIENRDIEAEIGKKRIVHGAPAKAAELRAFLLTMLNTVRSTPQMLEHAAMRKALEQAIYGSLLAAIGNGSEIARTPSTSQTRRQIVDRARDYMRTHIDEPITVADLCAELNVSRRTLQYSFQDVLNLNPVSFLRAMRLNGVRRALRHADGENDSVADVAARWGFWHLSHFAADYKAMFGELPSETLRNSYNRRRLVI
jgi:AraC family transcriptional regulator, ethanolamine operon transcriptional activator